jgi:hypothetical protein
MRASLNVSIRWEMNFYDKNTCWGKGNIGANLIFPKYLFDALLIGLQSQKCFFDLFFDRVPSSGSKGIFEDFQLLKLKISRFKTLSKSASH